MKKVAIHNLGCKVNSYESESMEQLLIKSGYEIVPFSEDIPADIYIINTCSVTNIADRKSRQMLHKAKKMNPDAIVIACGCYVQANPEETFEDDCVDLILGNNMKINVVNAIEEYCKNNGNGRYMVDINDKDSGYEALSIERTGEHTRAFIKIQDGCNQFCSYCIIPYLRGRIRSRDITEIVAETMRLSSNGVKEVVLTGIHISSYGMDDKEERLIDVIKAVHEVEGIERIRLGSLEPRIVTWEFVSELSRLGKVCPHFHLSLQSGCDKTLKAMNRHYTTEEYLNGCDILRKFYDNPAITTDVIVGFPDENDADFECTRLFLEKVRFYEMHIFKFSRRKGTAADKMTGQVRDEIKQQRSAVLLELEKRLSTEYRKMFLGKRVEVLIEEMVCIDNTQYYIGHTPNYLRIAIDKNTVEVYAKNNRLKCAVGEIVECDIYGLSGDEQVLMAR